MTNRMVTQDENPFASAARISALKKTGLDDLLARVERALAEEMIAVRVQIPYKHNELVALFHQRGIVEQEEFVEQGTIIRGSIAARLVERFEEYEI